jgi:hypothetical protein
VPESAAPVMRDMLATQEGRLNASRLGLILAGVTMPDPIQQTAPLAVLQSDIVSSGFDPEFEVFAMPGQIHLARIFYMSTVGNIDTHMFECKAEVLGWKFNPAQKPTEEKKLSGKEEIVLVEGSGDKKSPLALPKSVLTPPKGKLDVFNAPKLWPGFTAKIRFPMRSSPNAVVIPEEAVRHTEKGVIAFVPEEVRMDGGKTEWVARARVLDVGFRGEGWIEIRRGLTVGERVVQRGAEALEDGTPIRFGK